jgi:hypothetical protein
MPEAEGAAVDEEADVDGVSIAFEMKANAPS